MIVGRCLEERYHLLNSVVEKIVAFAVEKDFDIYDFPAD